MRKEDYFFVASHRAKCSLDASPNQERYESDLVAGGDVDRIRRALDGEIKKKAGKRGTVSRRAILKHREHLPYLGSAKGRAEAAPIPELSDEEIVALPFSELKERFQRMLWETCPDIVAEVRRRVTDASDKMSFDELVESMRAFEEVTQILREMPVSGADAATSTPKSSLIELAEMIMEPEDREAFIGMRRSMQGNLREALRILERYEKPPGGGPPGEDKASRTDKATR